MNLFENTQILLRAPEPEDLDELYGWENDPHVWFLSGTYSPYSRYVLKQFLDNSGRDIYDTRQLRLMIQRKEDDKLVGAIDLFEFDPKHHRAGVGILIAHKEDRRRGYAREALATVENYAKKVLNLHQLYCNIGCTNEGSIRLFTDMGFKEVGIKKDWLFKDGSFHDEIMFQKILTQGQSSE